MKKDITELFIWVDDFCQQYDAWLASHTLPAGSKPTRTPGLQTSEIMTILLLFHQSPAKNFKFFYLSYLQLYRGDFPNLPSYNRFVELQQRCLGHFYAFLMILCSLAQQTGLAYMDATCLPVCHLKLDSRNKVFKDQAALGKSTMGWFFGFKRHLIINEKGELLQAHLTPGNVDDRKLFQDLYERVLKLVTGIKANMKNKLLPLREKILLRKRSIIETVNSVIKKDFQICHTRHRFAINAFIHIFSTLVAYAIRSKKPAIRWNNLIPN